MAFHFTVLVMRATSSYSSDNSSDDNDNNINDNVIYSDKDNNNFQ